MLLEKSGKLSPFSIERKWKIVAIFTNKFNEKKLISPLIKDPPKTQHDPYRRPTEPLSRLLRVEKLRDELYLGLRE